MANFRGFAAHLSALCGKSGVANNGIHFGQFQGGVTFSFKRIVWQVQEPPIMRSMYGHFQGGVTAPLQ